MNYKVSGDGCTFFPAQWPESMERWVEGNAALIGAVQETLGGLKSPVTENRLWEAIARNHSPDWAAARRTLREAEKALHQMMSPENAPLGLIGGALACEETNAAQKDHRDALASFTIIDEALRLDEDLSSLHAILVAHHRMLSQSARITMNMRDVTERTLPDESGGVSLKDYFMSCAGRLFGKKPGARPGAATPEGQR